jgi:hypothetical protein
MSVAYAHDGMKVFSPEVGFVMLQGISLLRACRFEKYIYIYMLKVDEVLN